jgi:comEA protein
MLSGGLLVLGLVVLSGSLVHAGQKPEPARPANVVVQPSVNLNTATMAQLETLPGVGRSVAERIVEYRQKNGGFKKIEELMNVKGIGEKTFLKLKPMVFVPKPADKPTGAQ